MAQSTTFSDSVPAPEQRKLDWIGVTPRELAGFLAMVFGMFMAILDIQIVSASLSEIQAGLSASGDEIPWVQTSYLIAEVVMIPLSGLLARALSTRVLFTASAIGFTIASVLCATATTIDQMIVYRALQGFIGGGMIPSVFAVAFSLFPASKRGIVSPIIGLVATLAPTIGPTLELMLASLVWAIPLGIAMGTVGAYYRGTFLDRIIMAASVAGVSIPVFFLGLTLIWFLGFQYQLLPFTGRPGPVWTWEGFKAVILPAITLGGVFVGPVARMTRSSVLDVLGADHVRTARAKGLPERTVVSRHALRNALVPVVTLIGLQIGFLLGGAVVTETVFSWPGIGRLAVGAILSSDLPMAQGTIIVLSLGFIVINLTVDMLYAALDPRVRGA